MERFRSFVPVAMGAIVHGVDVAKGKLMIWSAKWPRHAFDMVAVQKHSGVRLVLTPSCSSPNGLHFLQLGTSFFSFFFQTKKVKIKWINGCAKEMDSDVK